MFYSVFAVCWVLFGCRISFKRKSVVIVLSWCCHGVVIVCERGRLQNQSTLAPRVHEPEHVIGHRLITGWLASQAAALGCPFLKRMTLDKHADIRLIGPSAVVCNSILSTPLHPIYIPYTKVPPISDVLSAERRLTHPFRSNRPPTYPTHSTVYYNKKSNKNARTS